MKRFVLASALLAIAIATRADDQNIDWHTNYRAALQKARAENKPLLVEFRCEA